MFKTFQQAAPLMSVRQTLGWLIMNVQVTMSGARDGREPWCGKSNGDGGLY